jgi:hypothetical protein
MKISLPVVLIFCACYFCNCVSAQQKNVSDHITSSLEKYTSAFQQEKLYLHFDKEYYSPGDTIWFKAYQVNASSHQPDSLSRIIYVDLISPKNALVSQLKLISGSGFSHGDFSLSDTLQLGNYRVRAYTNWMRNFDPAFFYTKAIPVYSLDAITATVNLKADATIKPKAPIVSDSLSTTKLPIDVQFFPEGGYLLDGLPVKVAFKATLPSGKGGELKGNITDDEGQFITSFTTNKLGMGNFILVAKAERKYSARLEGMNFKPQRYELPKAIKDGYTLSLNYFKPGHIRVNARTNITSVQPKQVTLIGQCRGEVYFTAKADISKKGSFFIDIPKAVFPSGIVQFTLFDDQDAPQSERLAFVNHMDKLNMEVTTAKNVYNPRERVELDLKVTNQKGHPVSANLSLSVTDAGQGPVLDSLRENIVTNLLLRSDLKGHIESPQQYFRDTTKQTQQALDLLMLTHGWRRFAWKEVLTDSVQFLRFAAEKELSFSGSLANGKKTIEENRLTMMLMSAQPQVLQSPVGKNQDFYFGLPDFQDSVNVVLQTTNSKGKQREMQVSVDENPSPEIIESSFDDAMEIPQEIKTALSKNTSINGQKKKFESNVVLNQVVIKAKVPMEKVGMISVQKIDLEDIEKTLGFDYPSIFHLVAAQIKGNVRLDYEIVWLVLQPKAALKAPPVEGAWYFPNFIIDGARYRFPLEVPLISTRSIKSIEIGEKFSNEAYIKTQEGITNDVQNVGKWQRFQTDAFVKEIHITTYKDGFRRSYPAGINTFKIAGFSKVREFYSPKYQAIESDKKDDNRSTLYWNPNVQTDKNGGAKLSFYNSDQATIFSINVEGVSGEGNVGTADYRVK